MHADCLNQYKPGALYCCDNVEFILIISISDYSKGTEPMLTSFNCYFITKSKHFFDKVNGYYLASCDEIA